MLRIGLAIFTLVILLSTYVHGQDAEFEGPENLENCRQTSKRCVSSGTIMVSGRPVHAPCWKWETIWECDRAGEIERGCDLLRRQSPGRQDFDPTSGVECRQVLSMGCFGRNGHPHEHGLCTKTSHRYTCKLPIKFSGNRFEGSDTTISEVPGVGAGHDFLEEAIDKGATLRIAYGVSLLERSLVNGGDSCLQQYTGCVALDAEPICTAANNVWEFSRPGEAYPVYDNGQRIYRRTQHSEECWKWASNFHCASGTHANDCMEYRDREDCTLQGSDCVSTNNDGECTHTTFTYLCGDAGNPDGGEHTQTCGSQKWCVGEDCTDIEAHQPNQAFGLAASGMNVLQEIANDLTPLSATDVTIFGGQSESCSKWPLDTKDCCKSGGVLLDAGLTDCSSGEQALALKRGAGQAHHVRSYCSNETFFGVCLERTSDFCTFKSRLSRIIQVQGRAQLGIGWGSCRGLTTDELEMIDWSQIDLSEVLGDVHSRMTVPEANALKAELKEKVEDFYDNIRIPEGNTTNDGDDDENL
jgi:hypothetical protein